MRLLCVILFFISSNSFSQNEVKSLEALNLNAGLQILRPSSLSYLDFKSSFSGTDFFIESTSAKNTTSEKLFSRQFVSGSVQFRILKDKSLGWFKKFNFNIGSSFSSGQNLSYSFTDNYLVRGDSVWITQGGETDLYFSDSIHRIETNYFTQLKNIGFFSEFWLSTAEKNSGASIGFGLSGQFSIENNVFLTNDSYYTTALYDESGNVAFVKPSQSSSSNSYATTLSDSYNRSVTLPPIYIITPYIPIRFEAALSESPTLSDFSIELFAKVGYEFQFYSSNMVAGRLSSMLGFGLNYYL
jgi:hypothetical protein